MCWLCIACGERSLMPTAAIRLLMSIRLGRRLRFGLWKTDPRPAVKFRPRHEPTG